MPECIIARTPCMLCGDVGCECWRVDERCDAEDTQLDCRLDYRGPYQAPKFCARFNHPNDQYGFDGRRTSCSIPIGWIRARGVVVPMRRRAR